MKLVVLTVSVFVSISLFLLSSGCIGRISRAKSRSVYLQRSNKNTVIIKVRVIKSVGCCYIFFFFLWSVVLAGMTIGLQWGTQRHKGATIQPTHTHTHTHKHAHCYPFHHHLTSASFLSISSFFFFSSTIVRDGFIPVNTRTLLGCRLGSAALEESPLQMILAFSPPDRGEIKISCSLKIIAGLPLSPSGSAVRTKPSQPGFMTCACVRVKQKAQEGPGMYSCLLFSLYMSI